MAIVNDANTVAPRSARGWSSSAGSTQERAIRPQCLSIGISVVALIVLLALVLLM